MIERIALRRGHPEVRAMLARTYPNYRGRKVRLEAAETYTLENYWGGGTKHHVVAVNMTTGKVVQPNGNTTCPYNTVAHATIELTPETMLVEHTIFCGHDVGITFIVHPDAFPKMLTGARL